LYIATTLLLGFSAVNTGNNLLFLVVSGLLAFMSVTGMAGMLNLKGLTPEILPPPEIFAGTAAPCRIRVKNSKRLLPSFLINVRWQDGEGVTFPVVASRGNTSGSLPMLFQKRGPARIDSITISSPFPVGFFTRYWTFTHHTEFIVFPRLIPSSRSAPGMEQRLPGNSVSQAWGHDGELERISSYSGREPLRVIHWKLSARGDALLVKEFGSQTAPPLVVDPDAMAGESLDERVSRAAWLVRKWVAQRPVGLRLGARTIPPAMGAAHSLMLMKELALYGLD
jgi:uncharacterized protein (DUF58 family)